MAWAILFTVLLLNGLQVSFGLMLLFKNSPRRPEPSGPFRRPSTEWQDWHSPRYVLVNGRRVRENKVLEKVNWKEDGF